jgi:Flp pilus assembly protein TadD
MLRKPAVTLCCALLLATAANLAAMGSPKKDDPSEHAKLYNQGVELMEKGKFADAEKRFEAALAKKEDFAEAHNNLGYSLRKQGKEHWAAALEHYDRAIALDPKLAEAYMYRGVLFTLQGDEAKAKADHEKLAKLDPRLAEQLLQAIASHEEPAGTAGLAPRWKPQG